jgi:hypothetical protein
MLHLVIDVVIVFADGFLLSFADASIPMCLSHTQRPPRSHHILAVTVSIIFSFVDLVVIILMKLYETLPKGYDPLILLFLPMKAIAIPMIHIGCKGIYGDVLLVVVVVLFVSLSVSFVK